MPVGEAAGLWDTCLAQRSRAAVRQARPVLKMTHISFCLSP
jgi:hypothetical protein